jgi:hypothetical protein
MGFDAAEETRRRMAKLLGCEPRNIFFGNSAMRTLIPIFLCLAKRGKWKLIVRPSDFAAIGGIARATNGILSGNITRQNYGEGTESERLRSFRDIANLKAFIKRYRLTLCTTKNHYTDGYKGPKVKKGEQYVIYCTHTHRETGEDDTAYAYRIAKRIKSRSGIPDPLVIVDASHSVGAVRFEAPALGDIVIMNSSKALDGEPTIGICYASDRVIRLMEEELENTGWPRIAFQFSPETKLGAHSGTDAAGLDNWMTLPEIYSLRSVLRNLSIEERLDRLKKLRDYFNCMLRFFKLCGGVEWDYVTVAPNFASFDIDYSYRYPNVKVGEPVPMLSKEIEPFRITAEWPRRTTLGGGFLMLPPFNQLSNMIRFRVSWGVEHTIDDMRELCRAIANALAGDTPNCAKQFETLDLLLTPMFGYRDIVRVYGTERERIPVRLAIATTHPAEGMRMAALKMIEEEDRIYYIAQSADYEDVALAATAMLKENGEMLLNLAKRGGPVSDLARKMLEGPQFEKERSDLQYFDRIRGKYDDLGQFSIDPIK